MAKEITLISLLLLVSSIMKLKLYFRNKFMIFLRNFEGFLAHRPVFDHHIHPLNQTVEIGGRAIFDCKYVSDVEVAQSWYKTVNKTLISIPVIIKIEFC